MKSLEIDHNTVAVDNLHTILSVCQQLRVNAEQDAENLTRMQNEHDALLERFEQLTKTMQNDREIIAEQRDQIGKSNNSLQERFGPSIDMLLFKLPNRAL